METMISVGFREMRLTMIAPNGAPRATIGAAASQFAETSGSI